MRVEVQNNFLGGTRNDANMSTPSDGTRPRMQLSPFSGPETAALTLTPGGNVAVATAAFGPTSFDITALVALANDGAGVPTDACEPLSGFSGKIVLVDRGTCGFTIKARNVQTAGGVGMIVVAHFDEHHQPEVGHPQPGRSDRRDLPREIEHHHVEPASRAGRHGQVRPRAA